MKRSPSAYETSIEAFRAMTVIAADGAATRARVLARIGQGETRRAGWRLALGTLAVAVVLLSAAVAWTRIGDPWRAPRSIRIGDTGSELAFSGAPSRVRHPLIAIPPLAPTGSGSGLTDDGAAGEARAYSRAHQAHFFDDAPVRAFPAWNDYLRLFPHGRFAPEARFNRALCLLRLGRSTEAARALQGFARDEGDGYRRAEAKRLLASLGDPGAD